MPTYAVSSPVWTETEPILDDGTGPLEDNWEYTEVDAPTAREAKIIAVRLWRNENKSFWEGFRHCDDDANPFTGVKAINLDKMEVDDDEA